MKNIGRDGAAKLNGNSERDGTMITENLSVGEIQRQLREHIELLQSTDFDQLCDDGVLERKGKNKYKVPSLQHLKQLPEKLRIQIENFKVHRDGSVVLTPVKLTPRLLRRLKNMPTPKDEGSTALMESFRYVSVDDQERQYAEYRDDSEWPGIYRFLRRGFWHVTSLKAWDEIQKSGAIKPNIGGKYPMRFDHDTLRSYGYIHECVALFDFVSPTEEEIIRVWDRACDVLADLETDTVLLHLDRSQLEPKIIPENHSSVPELINGKAKGRIPFCEVWYPDGIPLDAVTEVFRVPPPSRFGAIRPERMR